MDLLRVKVDIDCVVGEKSAELFADADGLEQRASGVWAVRIHWIGHRKLEPERSHGPDIDPLRLDATGTMTRPGQRMSKRMRLSL